MASDKFAAFLFLYFLHFVFGINLNVFTTFAYHLQFHFFHLPFARRISHDRNGKQIGSVWSFSVNLGSELIACLCSFCVLSSCFAHTTTFCIAITLQRPLQTPCSSNLCIGKAKTNRDVGDHAIFFSRSGIELFPLRLSYQSCGWVLRTENLLQSKVVESRVVGTWIFIRCGAYREAFSSFTSGRSLEEDTRGCHRRVLAQLNVALYGARSLLYCGFL